MTQIKQIKQKCISYGILVHKIWFTSLHLPFSFMTRITRKQVFVVVIPKERWALLHILGPIEWESRKNCSINTHVT